MTLTASIEYRRDAHLAIDQVLALYRANAWSSASKPERLMAALAGSDSVVTAWQGARLIGLGNAISDGHLVAYYPHLLVLPEYQGHGVGSEILCRLLAHYEGLHQHVLVADGAAVGFYRGLGFVRAGRTEPMWTYSGDDHQELEREGRP